MKALTIGGATIDTIAIIESDHIERITMQNADTSFLLLKEGAKTEATQVSTHCGGGAVNSAVGMARLGLDVSAMIKLGRDDRAETIVAKLLAEGASVRWAVRDARLPTGASVMISSHDRNAAVFTFRGANTLLTGSDLKDEAFSVDLVHIAPLSNKSAECFPQIVARAKAAKAFIVANPGPRQIAARGAAFEQCLGDIDALSINRAEAELLLPPLTARFGEGGPLLDEPDLPALAAKGFWSGDFRMSLVAFMRAARTLGPKYILVTDGGDGAYLCTGDEILFCPPVPDVTVAGTAGAGDAFSSTFGVFAARGAAPEQAMRAAAINAANVVAHIDTQSGLLNAPDMDAQLHTLQDRLSVRRWPLAN